MGAPGRHWSRKKCSRSADCTPACSPASTRLNLRTTTLQQCAVVPYLRLIDSCITQLEAQGPSRTCNESKEEEADTLEYDPFIENQLASQK